MRLAAKLYASFLAILLVPTIVSGIITYETVQHQVTQDINQSATNSIQLLSRNINQLLVDNEDAVNILANSIDAGTIGGKQGDETPQIRHLIDQYQQANPDIESICVGTDKGVYMNAPKSLTNPPGYDPRVRPWYQLSMAHPNTAQINAPFVSKASGGVVVAIGQRTKDGHGVVLVSLSLQSIASTTKAVNIGQGGFVRVIDQTGHYLIDASYKPGSMVQSPQLGSMMKGNSGDFTYTSKAGKRDVVYTTDPLTGWKIAAVFSQSTINSSALRVFMTILVAMIVALVLGGALILYLVRSITKRLKIIVAATSKVASGDLTHSLVDHHKDEIGELSVSFNAMRESLQDVLHNALLTSSEVISSSQALSSIADEANKAIEQVVNNTQEMAEIALQQLDLVHKSDKSITSMAQGMGQIAQTVDQVSIAAQHTTDLANEGNQSIDNVVYVMEGIESHVQGLAISMDSLEKYSSQIGQIVHIISEVASQTNLLALNAAIEAARAGEHGRGFAVVADEVRKLAEQVTAFSGQIGELIENIHDEMGRSMAASVSTKDVVQEGLETVRKTGDAFVKIVQAVREVADHMKDAAQNATHVSASGDVIIESIHEISRTAQSSANGTQSVSAATQEQLASMEEVAASAASLAQIAESLQLVMARFKL